MRKFDTIVKREGKTIVMTTKRIKTSKQEIATFWQDRIESDAISITYKQATTHCWRCGVKKRLDRCHILADALGGEDTPGNFVLLCKHCHFDNPNISNMDIVWDWLKAYQLHEGETFWFQQGLREFHYIYGKTLDEELLTLGYNNRDTFEIAFQKQLQHVTHHFGQPRNNRATVAGAMKLALKSLTTKDEKHD